MLRVDGENEVQAAAENLDPFEWLSDEQLAVFEGREVRLQASYN